MASIAILCHELDRILWPRLNGDGYNCPYLIGRMALELIRRGHDVEIVHGLQAKNPDPDLAILHVDLTRVPDDYLAFAAGFRNCLNARIADISKSVISGALLADRPDWNGPVIVKSDLNCNGGGESIKSARERGETPKPSETPDYPVFENIDAVPEAFRNDPTRVIDRFMPEREGDMYAIRHWMFCGDYGHCYRYLSHQPIIKAGNVIAREQANIPSELIQTRANLGFDFGKFDFVEHRDGIFLLDANKTPGSPPGIALADGVYMNNMCNGLLSYIS